VTSSRNATLAADEVAYWIKAFGGRPESAPSAAKSRAAGVDADSPFPPGYGEDVLEG
jgi:hypothetical protein